MKHLLLQYLRERELNGEKITPESYIIVKQRSRGHPIRIHTAEKRWHKLLILANRAERKRRWYNIRLHTLRKFFKTYATFSGLSSELIELFMGHAQTTMRHIYFLPELKQIDTLPREKILKLHDKYSQKSNRNKTKKQKTNTTTHSSNKIR
ncbi:MAG: tyrosine-type recombinase/integrase [archaeon GB-1867-035]|nr:tyrosine-type recombinase/integrase [Candidatus Culexmicrobium profundum]